jgi:hypothetical protein
MTERQSYFCIGIDDSTNPLEQIFLAVAIVTLALSGILIMSFGAIVRTRVLLAKVKSGVPMAMTNWWKKTVEVEGEVRISYS